jgi:hypothetical protein
MRNTIQRVAVDREAFNHHFFDNFDEELALIVVIDGEHLWQTSRPKMEGASAAAI